MLCKECFSTTAIVVPGDPYGRCEVCIHNTCRGIFCSFEKCHGMVTPGTLYCASHHWFLDEVHSLSPFVSPNSGMGTPTMSSTTMHAPPPVATSSLAFSSPYSEMAAQRMPPPPARAPAQQYAMPARPPEAAASFAFNSPYSRMALPMPMSPAAYHAALLQQYARPVAPLYYSALQQYGIPIRPTVTAVSLVASSSPPTTAATTRRAEAWRSTLATTMQRAVDLPTMVVSSVVPRVVQYMGAPQIKIYPVAESDEIDRQVLTDIMESRRQELATVKPADNEDEVQITGVGRQESGFCQKCFRVETDHGKFCVGCAKGEFHSRYPGYGIGSASPERNNCLIDSLLQLLRPDLYAPQDEVALNINRLWPLDIRDELVREGRARELEFLGTPEQIRAVLRRIVANPEVCLVVTSHLGANNRIFHWPSFIGTAFEARYFSGPPTRAMSHLEALASAPKVLWLWNEGGNHFVPIRPRPAAASS